MTARTSTDTYQFFAACPRNTEGLLADELRALGGLEVAETRAGVAFSGPLMTAYRACLWSRVASRVLLQLAIFPMGDPDHLYEIADSLSWGSHLDRRGTLAVEVTSAISRGPLAQMNTHYAEQRVKDAIVDQFRCKTGVRPSVDLARPDVRVNVHLEPEQAIVSLDLSGDALHRRGYRLEGRAAPLKENLAAAVLIRAGWPEIARAGKLLVDPMCGSGTFLVEGAMIAADVAPGLLREYYGFLRWRGFDAGQWEELLAEARERADRGLASLAPVYGFDIDPRAVDAARANVRRAGLVGKILVERRDLSSLTPPDAPRPAVGLVIANPPYGKRLGEQQELVGLYEELGETLKRSFSGWTAAILTGNPELGAHLGLRARRTNVFYNGSILCKLLTFDVDPVQYGTQGALRAAEIVSRSAPVAQAEIAAHIAAPVPAAELGEPDPTFARDSDAAAPVVAALGSGGEMFANRLRKNLKHLRGWAAREDVHCFRVYDADLPEYAVAVDIYEDWAHVQEYAPPRTVDPVHARRRIKEVMVAVPEVLGIPSARVILKVRRQQRGAEQYQKVDERGEYVEAREGGLRFLVNLTDYLDTGLFLDHRLTRALIRELAPGRRFLNLFAYTGAATVYAAAGEATSTTTVDLSANYLEWARRNLDLNNLDGPQHHLVQADCLVWLRETAAKIRRAAPLRATTARDGRAPMGTAPAGPYDLILLDAPTFSNSKRMEGTLDLQRDHVDLIEAAAALLSPEGILVFSTNFRRFKLDPALLEAFCVDDISKKTLPPDFERNPRIHSCFRIMRRGAAPPAPPTASQTGWSKEPHAL